MLTWTQLLGDTTQPFTLVVPEGDVRIKGSFESYNTMIIVQNGKIIFENMDCNDQDLVKGIFIAKDGFDTTATKNTSVSAGSWCVGGSLRVQGILIGTGINENLYSKRRSTFDSW